MSESDDGSDERYRQAGLYDPAVDAETGRRELLRWLEDEGFSFDEIIEAFGRGALGSLASDRQLVPRERHSRAESERISGLSPAVFDAIIAAFGFAPLDEHPGQLTLSQAEIDVVANFGALISMFFDDEGLGFVRVVGNSITRIAEAAVSMFVLDVESPHLRSEGSELVLAQKVVEAVALLDDFTPQLDTLLRRALLQAAERGRKAVIGETERLVYRYAVGFVDLVGFTPISHEMDAPALGAFIRGFEQRAQEAVASVGARLVKLIGDEVMFVAPSADAACQVAQQLMLSVTTEGGRRVEPRGGMAYGDVLVRGGDYYGETVNLASRLADDAQPSELLVSEPFAEADTFLKFEPAGRRALKGFTGLVEVRSFSFGTSLE